MRQNHPYSALMRPLFKNQKHIHNQSTSLAGEQLAFLGGKALGDIDIFTESGETQRKVRRIIEKRVCQDMHRKGRVNRDNFSRINGRRRVSNQLRNIFGDMPSTFTA